MDINIYADYLIPAAIGTVFVVFLSVVILGLLFTRRDTSDKKIK
jgi:hypothetical protein